MNEDDKLEASLRGFKENEEQIDLALYEILNVFSRQAEQMWGKEEIKSELRTVIEGFIAELEPQVDLPHPASKYGKKIESVVKAVNKGVAGHVIGWAIKLNEQKEEEIINGLMHILAKADYTKQGYTLEQIPKKHKARLYDLLVKPAVLLANTREELRDTLQQLKDAAEGEENYKTQAEELGRRVDFHKREVERERSRVEEIASAREEYKEKLDVTQAKLEEKEKLVGKLEKQVEATSVAVREWREMGDKYGKVKARAEQAERWMKAQEGQLVRYEEEKRTLQARIDKLQEGRPSKWKTAVVSAVLGAGAVVGGWFANAYIYNNYVRSDEEFLSDFQYEMELFLGDCEGVCSKQQMEDKVKEIIAGYNPDRLEGDLLEQYKGLINGAADWISKNSKE